MFRLNSLVVIEKEYGARYIFNGIAGCRLETDMSSLTSTCTVKLPRKIKWGGARIPIDRGDDITIRLGYDENLTVRFVPNEEYPVLLFYAPLDPVNETRNLINETPTQTVNNVTFSEDGAYFHTTTSPTSYNYIEYDFSWDLQRDFTFYWRVKPMTNNEDDYMLLLTAVRFSDTVIFVIIRAMPSVIVYYKEINGMNWLEYTTIQIKK